MYRIGGLVKKDFLLIKRFAWLMAIYAIIFSEIVQKGNQSLIYSLFPGLLLILSISADSQRTAQQFLASLPVSRNRLVLSKYLSSFVINILSILVCAFLDILSDALYGRSIQLNTTLFWGTFLTMTVFIAVYLPFFYWLGLKGFQIVNVVMMMFVMAANGAATWLLANIDIKFLKGFSFNRPEMTLIFLPLLVMLLLVISYLISSKLYRKKDL